MSVIEAHPVEPDELADEDLLPDEDVGVDANGRRESAALTALRELGPASATEVAAHVGNEPANVATRLRQLEKAGKVRRTGRMINQDGQRGGPQIEWELMPANGHATGPTTTLTGTGPVEDRMRKLAEQIGRANGTIETLQNELEGAKTRADQADQRSHEAERRRQDAERRLASVVDRQGDTGLQTARVRELETQHAELERELVDAREQIQALMVRPSPEVEGGGIHGNDMRARYFDLLLAQAGADGAEEHVYDRLERLIGLGE